MPNKKFLDSTLIIAAITIYAYAATVLIQFGQNSYFNTHQSFIDVSIRENIVWFFVMFDSAKKLFTSMWQAWIMFFSFLVCIVFMYYWYKNAKWKAMPIVLSIILFMLSLQIWFSFGLKFASIQTNHLILAPSCDFTSSDKEYVVTSIYEGKAVIVSVDKSTRKMEQKFFVKDLSSLTCGLEYKEIGKIEK